jgi:ribosomal protein S18 acetylase RimI-like enzyme
VAQGPATIEIKDETLEEPRGLELVLLEAWSEAGRKPSMPWGWRPFDPARAHLIAARSGGGELEGLVALRPQDGMDTVDFFYVRRRARAGDVQERLLAAAAARLREIGRTRIIYVGYGWWRAPFADDIAAGFARAGWGRFEGVFLARPIEPGGPPPEPLPSGYEFEEWSDARYPEVCDVMLRSPEPEALYWDMGLVRRSILNAAQPLPPLFRDGLAQIVVRTEDRAVAAFTLATVAGYVNHVYTDPQDRGRGLGRAMVVKLLGAMARIGLARATILTHDTNPKALALYERLGFCVDFRYPQFYLRW